MKTNYNAGYHEFRIDLFPGIFLEYYFSEGSHVFASNDSSIKGIMSVNYAYQGGYEAELSNKKRIYRGDKVATVSSSDCFPINARIPQGVYESISIAIDLDNLPSWLKEMFSFMGFDLKKSMIKFGLRDGWFTIPMNDRLEAVFDDIYKLLHSNELNILRSKVLLLFSLIFGNNIQTNYKHVYIPQNQYIKVLGICRELEKRDNYRVPVSDLVELHGMNYTAFQTIFKEVYNVSPSKYRKQYRLNDGAYLLKHTNMSVMDIAGICGYDNASKFSTAFKDFTGMTPSHYRVFQTKDR